MAATRARQAAVGSSQWILEEKRHAQEAVASELADFGFSVGNEMDWLNEKMLDIFSQDAKTLTDVLKTPGRLRGKTPRTLRKDVQSARKPLADIFAPNLNAASTPVPAQKPDAHSFKVIEDVENQQPYSKPVSRSKSPQRKAKPGNTDSGYHGMTEDETDTDSQSVFPSATYQLQEVAIPPTVQELPSRQAIDDTNQTGDESFQSAREDAQPAAIHAITDDLHAKQLSSSPFQVQPAAFPGHDHGDLEATEVDMIDDAGDETEIAKPSQRKSSFTFSSLPAREPLHSKRSIGGRNSYLEMGARTSILSKAVRNASGNSVAPEEKPHVLENKSSAQRLHERITMLGKTREPRPSTLMPVAAPEVTYPTLPTASASQPVTSLAAAREASQEPQHAASQPVESLQRPSHQKHFSVPDFSASTKAGLAEQSPKQKAVSLFEVAAASPKRTPSNSSRLKKPSEGPLSASKSKLMSVFKTARNIFASSAGTSAAAKLEAHDASPDRQAMRDISNGSSAAAAVRQMPGALYSDSNLASKTFRAEEELQRKQEKELQAQLDAEAKLEQAREQERIKVAKEAEDRRKQEEAASMKPPSGKLKSVSKPVKPVKDAIAKPAPVNIKVGSQLKALQEPISRPGSAMRPSSAMSTVKGTTTATTNSRARALEAATRKKELEEREKQRKAQQKKDLERKRLAKLEEEQRAEAARKAEEQRLAQEEQKRQQLRAQQQRQAAQKREEEAARAKAAHELAEAIQRERAQQQAQSQPRSDITGTLRQLGSKLMGEGSIRPQVNPAKPPKRVHDDEQQARPAAQGSNYQQNDGKRRKTDEKVEASQRVSVMGPPKRPSAIRKETLTRFPLGYTAAPTQPAHQPPTMFKAVVNNHQQNLRPVHPSQMAQTSTARIAFAESSAPTTAMANGHDAHQPGKFKTPVRPVPVASAKSAKSSPAFIQGDAIALPEIATDSEEEDDEDQDEGTGFRAPSWVASPALRELLTQQQLVDPESVFGPIGELKMEEVFRGTKSADRLKKFRDRGSSAAWVQNGDAVTSAEKRRDMQMRERVAREGGWRYEPGL